MRVLDLFCGAGGAAVGYHRAGFEVVGVDIEHQPNYPFEFHMMDVMDGLDLVWTHVSPGEPFRAIHASPPCQRYTAYGRRDGVDTTEHPDLVGLVREDLLDSGLPYVIENVVGAPLVNPIRLCGSSFGLDVQRHRLFESNVPLMSMPCDHSRWEARFPQATNRKNKRRTVEVGVWRIPLSVQQKAMGIDWMTREELSQAVPPAYTEFVGSQLMRHLRVEQHI